MRNPSVETERAAAALPRKHGDVVAVAAVARESRAKDERRAAVPAAPREGAPACCSTVSAVRPISAAVSLVI